MPISRHVAQLNKRVTNHLTRPFAARLPGFAIVRHVGRRSGRTYETPVNLFRRGDQYVVALTYGEDSEWVKNVLAAGGCEIRTRGDTVRLTSPRIFSDARRQSVPAPVRLPLRLLGVTEFMSLRLVRQNAQLHPPVVVVMGVEGVGKTTVGRELAERLGVEFVDGDDFHSAEAKAQMAAGNPLDDAARAPWLDRLDAILREHATRGIVLACSALKRAYRQRLSRGVPHVVFVALVAPREVLEHRIAARKEHFAGLALLDSQLRTLELDDDVTTVDATQPLEDTVAAASRAVG